MALSTQQKSYLDTAHKVFDQLLQAVSSSNRFTLVAGMTLLLLLVKLEDIWYMQMGITTLGCAALLFRRLASHENFWFSIFVFLVVGLFNHWYSMDNHQYLIVLWCVAIGCSRMSDAPNQSLATSARLLIGLCFGFATLWKLTTPEYTDTTFFQHLLLADKRFEDISVLLGGTSYESLQINREIMTSWLRDGNPATKVPLTTGPHIAHVAYILTWWTVCIEGLISVSFLISPLSKIARHRDLFLLFFLFTTYIPAPVIGFAWLLAAMGLAQTSLEKKSVVPIFYLFTFLFLEAISHFPISTFIRHILALL